MPQRPTRRAALEAKKRLKETNASAPRDSDQAVLVTPRGGAGRGRVAAEKAEPEPEKPAPRRTRQAAAQANNRKHPSGQGAEPVAGVKAEDGAWAGRSAGAAEEPEPAIAPADPDMRAAKAEEADEKAGPSAKKDAAEDEASTAPLPEKVSLRCVNQIFNECYRSGNDLRSPDLQGLEVMTCNDQYGVISLQGCMHSHGKDLEHIFINCDSASTQYMI